MPHHTEHMPEFERLPASLKTLDWRLWVVGETSVYCGDQLLVAVPVLKNTRNPAEGWMYQCYVIHVYADDGHFGLLTPDGDVFGWDIEDVDFYVKINAANDKTEKVDRDFLFLRLEMIVGSLQMLHEKVDDMQQKINDIWS